MYQQARGLNDALVELERLKVLVVVTSRRAVNARLEGPLKVNLLGLAAADAIHLLRQRAGASVAIKEQEAAELASICGCNALAITVIAAFLSSGVVTPQVRWHSSLQPAPWHCCCCKILPMGIVR